jgi:predicted nucleotidyltransferase
MTEGERFEEALANLAAVFQERRIRYALIGGLAVSVWGTPRATEDIDVLADAGPSPELGAALRAAGFESEWRRGDSDDPVPLLLRLRGASGPEIDVICVTREWEREMLTRSVHVRIPTGIEIPVTAVEDLIVLKLIAGGPRDLADVAEILEHAGPLPELEKRAKERGVSALLRRIETSSKNQPRSE